MYELLYIVPAVYTEDELEKVALKIGELLKDGGAEITESKNLGKIKFAYPMKKQTVGYYVLTNFNAAAEALGKIDRILRLEKDVLRFLVTRAHKAARAAKIIEYSKIDPTARRDAGRDERKREAPRAAKEKIKLEDIGKQLETLLEKDIV